MTSELEAGASLQQGPSGCRYVKYCDDDTVKFNGLFDDIMNLWPRAPTGHLDGKVSFVLL